MANSYKNTEEKILAYLNQKMSEKDMIAFEKELETNSALQEEYHFLRQIKAGVYLSHQKERAENKVWINKLWNDAESQNKKKRRRIFYILFLSLISLCLVAGIWWYNQQKESKHVTDSGKSDSVKKVSDSINVPVISSKADTQAKPVTGVKENLPNLNKEEEEYRSLIEEIKKEKANIIQLANQGSVKIEEYKTTVKKLRICDSIKNFSGFSGNPNIKNPFIYPAWINTPEKIEKISDKQKLVEKISTLNNKKQLLIAETKRVEMELQKVQKTIIQYQKDLTLCESQP